MDIFFADNKNNKQVVISPLNLCDLSAFTTIVVFSTRNLPRNISNKAFYYAVDCANDALYQLQLDRNICTQAFSALKRKTKFDSIKGVYDKQLLGKITYEQFVVALRVFEELGFIKIVDKYTVEFDSSVKAPLDNSQIYKKFAI